MNELKKALMPVLVFLMGALSIIFGILFIDISEMKFFKENQNVWSAFFILFGCVLVAGIFFFYLIKKEKTHKIIGERLIKNVFFS